jgi:hypothetical protein
MIAQVGSKITESGLPIPFATSAGQPQQEFAPIWGKLRLSLDDNITIYINPVRRIEGFYRRISCR